MVIMGEKMTNIKWMQVAKWGKEMIKKNQNGYEQFA